MKSIQKEKNLFNYKVAVVFSFAVIFVFAAMVYAATTTTIGTGITTESMTLTDGDLVLDGGVIYLDNLHEIKWRNVADTDYWQVIKLNSQDKIVLGDSVGTKDILLYANSVQVGKFDINGKLLLPVTGSAAGLSIGNDTGLYESSNGILSQKSTNGFQFGNSTSVGSCTGATAGVVFYNTADTELCYCNGTSWQKVSDNTACTIID